MANVTKVVLAAAVVALAITSVGWFRAAADPDVNRFESCVATDGAVTLSYGYGANQRTAVVFDSRDDEATVALEMRKDPATHQTSASTVRRLSTGPEISTDPLPRRRNA